MNALIVDPTRPPAALPQKAFPTYVRLIRKHPKWASIQKDIVEGRLTPQKIAEKYKLRKANGALATFSVVRYGKLLRERHAELFEKLDEAEARAVICELQDNTRKVFEMAQAAYQKALESNEPHFGAAKDFLEVMLAANEHLSGVAGVAKEAEPDAPQVFQNYNVLQLPKAQPMQRVV